VNLGNHNRGIIKDQIAQSQLFNTANALSTADLVKEMPKNAVT
jgi:hypothetical protein